MNTTAWAQTYEGVTAFDQNVAGFYVPDAPDDSAHAPPGTVLWCGLENFPKAGGDWVSVIQPELWWQEGSGWQITTEALDNSEFYNLNDFSPFENVNVGDYLDCSIVQQSSTNWVLKITDETTGAYSSQNWQPGTGSNWGPYQWAQLAVYELADYPSGESLAYCDGLSKSNQEFFYPIALSQAGTAWNAFYDVLPTATVEPGYSSGYRCAFDATWSPWSSGDPYSYFSWKYQG